MDTLAGELSCKRGKNVSLPEDKSRKLEQNLRQIVESTLKVFFDLVYKLLYMFLNFPHICVIHYAIQVNVITNRLSPW